MRGGLNTKMLTPVWDKVPDGLGGERGSTSDLEGQRSRVEAGERKMSSVASTPFFMELLPPLDTHIYKHYPWRCTHTNTHTHKFNLKI